MKFPNKKIKILWISFLSGFLFLLFFIFAVSINLFGLFGKIPDLEVLENPKSEIATEIYSRDGVVLGKYYSTFNRSPAEFHEIPTVLKDALIATEDVRFHRHSGVDLKGMFAIFFYAVTFQKRGSSTITQQLAKNLFRIRNSQEYRGPLSSTWPVIKMKEWLIAVQLERSYTKNEILLMYLNTVDFGRNAYGIKSAARKYFNTIPENLKLEQAALLVGLLKGPSFYSPTRNEERALNRRNTVLLQMIKYDYLPEEKYDSLKILSLGLNLNEDDESTGRAPYFCQNIKSFLLNWCDAHDRNLYEDGLKIYTTIDYKMQTYAEQAVSRHMKYLQKEFFKHWKGRSPWTDENHKEIKGFIEKEAKKSPRYIELKKEYGKDEKAIMKVMKTPVKMRLFSWNGTIDTLISPLDSIRYTMHFLHTGFMSMDPKTGHVKAWVGDINSEFFKYDHVKQGKRQPGSSFKPILYAYAMDKLELTPEDSVLDVPTVFTMPDGKPWNPKNSNGKYANDYLTLKQGLAKSVNTVSAYLMSKVGPEAVVDFAKNMGIESPLYPSPSLALGTSDVSVYELVNAYSIFVNNGFWKKPLLITKIEDKYGNILEEFNSPSEQVLNEKTAYYMVQMLRGSVEEPGGTSVDLKRIYNINGEVGGKTGTTQSNADGWFIGITPELVSGVWVGAESKNIRFRTMELGQGAKLALPIWGLYMQQVNKNRRDLGLTKDKFDVPAFINDSTAVDSLDQDF
jgi:penicillin-binding protein 1A